MDLTQQQAADALGCKQSTISKIEDGVMLPGRALAVTIKRVTAQHDLGAIEVEEWGAVLEAKPGA